MYKVFKFYPTFKMVAFCMNYLPKVLQLMSLRFDELGYIGYVIYDERDHL